MVYTREEVVDTADHLIGTHQVKVLHILTLGVNDCHSILFCYVELDFCILSRLVAMYYYFVMYFGLISIAISQPYLYCKLFMSLYN